MSKIDNCITALEHRQKFLEQKLKESSLFYKGRSYDVAENEALKYAISMVKDNRIEMKTKVDKKDYEEPKRYWFIENDGCISSIGVDEDFAESLRASKEIGNYFETKEEAERAVEKLKAWKRLKDKGFRFTGLEDVERTIRFEIPYRTGYDSCEAEADLDLLFGGEE